MARDIAWTDSSENCSERPVTIQQNNITYHGHWHNEFAVFSDGSVLKAGWGWLDRDDSKRTIARFC